MTDRANLFSPKQIDVESGPIDELLTAIDNWDSGHPYG